MHGGKNNFHSSWISDVTKIFVLFPATGQLWIYMQCFFDCRAVTKKTKKTKKKIDPLSSESCSDIFTLR